MCLSLSFRNVLAAALACGLMSSIPVFCAEKAADPKPPAKAIPGDADGDGKVSYEEFVELTVERTMERLDKNNDAALSKKETRTAVKKEPKNAVKEQVSVTYTEVDENRDGKIDRVEFKRVLMDNDHMKVVFDSWEENLHRRSDQRDSSMTPTLVGVQFKM